MSMIAIARLDGISLAILSNMLNGLVDWTTLIGCSVQIAKSVWFSL